MTFLLRADNYPQERRSEPKALTHSNPIYVSVNKAGIINRSAPAERVAAVTESCPSHQTPGGCSAGAVAPRCPRRAKKSERGALFSSKSAPMSPERSSGQVWREATSGVSGQSPERASADALSAAYFRVCVKCAYALMGRCPKPSGAFAPPNPRAKAPPWIQGRVSVACASDL